MRSLVSPLVHMKPACVIIGVSFHSCGYDGLFKVTFSICFLCTCRCTRGRSDGQRADDACSAGEQSLTELHRQSPTSTELDVHDKCFPGLLHLRYPQSGTYEKGQGCVPFASSLLGSKRSSKHSKGMECSRPLNNMVPNVCCLFGFLVASLLNRTERG